jgi:peptidoglycan/xylan/chitin deacetylase (PgdA/CDA1 family)
VAAAAVLAAPALWPWVVGALVADHAVLVLGGLLPRSSLLAPTRIRLPAAAVARGEVALTFDDGPDPEVTPVVLRQLAAAGARATFFPIGRRAAAHPDLLRDVVDAGHDLGNHTWSHPNHFWFLPLSALGREIDRAQEVASAAGSTPRWFRAPAGIRSPWLEPVLAARGLGLCAWTRRGFDTVRTDAAAVAQRLVSDLAAGDILLLHDGSGARTATGRPVVLEVLPRVLEAIGAAGLTPVGLSARNDEP